MVISDQSVCHKLSVRVRDISIYARKDFSPDQGLCEQVCRGRNDILQWPVEHYT